MAKTKTCETCGESFDPNSNRQKYCKRCGRRGRARCQHCGQEFARTGNTKGLYCSTKCVYAARTDPARARRKCPECDEEFRPRRSDQQFCSRECRKRCCARTYTGIHDRVCAYCGAAFQTRRRRQQFCSVTCRGVFRRKPRIAQCERCGQEVPFNKRNRFQRFCSQECRGAPEGATKPSSGGYTLLRARNADGKLAWIFEHRHVMAAHLDRPLRAEEVVHHKNGVKTDNRLENLELWVAPSEAAHHPKGQRVVDLVAFVVTNYKPLVLAELEATG